MACRGSARGVGRANRTKWSSTSEREGERSGCGGGGANRAKREIYSNLPIVRALPVRAPWSKFTSPPNVSSSMTSRSISSYDECSGSIHRLYVKTTSKRRRRAHQATRTLTSKGDFLLIFFGALLFFLFFDFVAAAFLGFFDFLRILTNADPSSYKLLNSVPD